jgi:hypothetical protein
MDECKPLARDEGGAGGVGRYGVRQDGRRGIRGRGLHSFTFRVNVSAFLAIRRE